MNNDTLQNSYIEIKTQIMSGHQVQTRFVGYEKGAIHLEIGSQESFGDNFGDCGLMGGFPQAAEHTDFISAAYGAFFRGQKRGEPAFPRVPTAD